MGQFLPCFKAYDVRGKVPAELNEDVAYAIGRAFADETGAPVEVVWDGLCGRGRRGAEGASRALSTHYIHLSL
ncbi:MAG: hypothetical protein N2109_13340, partial [Fimbriimonadales bacterium]|nr:hypothetical protein [Fimbriimonadales bacterium]